MKLAIPATAAVAVTRSRRTSDSLLVMFSETLLLTCLPCRRRIRQSCHRPVCRPSRRRKYRQSEKEEPPSNVS